jgi:hypothetical protein
MHVLPRMMGAAALLNVVCNAWLVPRYGAVGAAVAAVTTYVFLIGFAWRADRSCFGIRVEWGRVLRVAAALGVTFALGRWVTPPNLIGQISAGCALILLYPALLGVFGFYSLAELEMMRGVVNRRLGPRAPRRAESQVAPASSAPKGSPFAASGTQPTSERQNPRTQRAERDTVTVPSATDAGTRTTTTRGKRRAAPVEESTRRD